MLGMEVSMEATFPNNDAVSTKVNKIPIVSANMDSDKNQLINDAPNFHIISFNKPHSS